MSEKFDGAMPPEGREAAQEKKGGMLMHERAIVGSPPKSEEELKNFLGSWIVPTWGGKQEDLDYGVMWLSDVAKISYSEALAALYTENPRIYDSLAFFVWGNGYAERAKNFKVDLLKALQEAAGNS